MTCKNPSKNFQKIKYLFINIILAIIINGCAIYSLYNDKIWIRDVSRGGLPPEKACQRSPFGAKMRNSHIFSSLIIPFSERKGYTAFKYGGKCLKFVRLSVQANQIATKFFLVQI